MIQANELRIGNLVKVPRIDQTPFRIDEMNLYPDAVIGVNGKVGMKINAGHPLTWYINTIDPLPLTAELLLKCGFEKRSLGDTFCYCLPFVRPLMSSKTAKHDLVLTSYGHIAERHDGKYAVAIREYDRDIQFAFSLVESAHQLQNLYFTITGTELEIKL